jgi:hypothetical protein
MAQQGEGGTRRPGVSSPLCLRVGRSRLCVGGPDVAHRMPVWHGGDVTVLDDDAAIGLLDGALRAARPEDDRVTARSGRRREAGRRVRRTAVTTRPLVDLGAYWAQSTASREQP